MKFPLAYQKSYLSNPAMTVALVNEWSNSDLLTETEIGAAVTSSFSTPLLGSTTLQSCLQSSCLSHCKTAVEVSGTGKHPDVAGKLAGSVS